MVKTYLRYKRLAVHGLVCSSGGGGVVSADGRFAVAPALESAIVWNLKTGSQAAVWYDPDNSAEISCIAASAEGNSNHGDLYAIGYMDGSIRLWSLSTNTSRITFNGHKAPITSLAFDPAGPRLVSGSKDTDIIVWDLESEAGLCRLRGHKDIVTDVAFLPSSTTRSVQGTTHFVSASKDSTVKVWDLTTRHCIQTLVGHRAEVSALCVEPTFSVVGNDQQNPRWLITAAIDTAELRVWKIDFDKLQEVGTVLHDSSSSRKRKFAGNGSDMDVDDNDLDEEDNSIPVGSSNGNATVPETVKPLTLLGVVPRSNSERVVRLRFHSSGKFFACQTADRNVEIFKIHTAAEVKKKINRRMKRIREKKKKTSTTEDAADAHDDDDAGDAAPGAAPDEEQITDWITSLRSLRFGAKIRSIDFRKQTTEGTYQLVGFLHNNSIEIHNMPSEKPTEDEPATLLLTIDGQGHRSDVRTLCLSSDSEMLASASNDSIKIWNLHSGACIRTIPSGYALCSAFVPGNKQVLIGTKAGAIELYDIASGLPIEVVSDAHTGAIWSLALRPDKRGFMTGSADKDVKFWDFDLVKDENWSKTTRRLTMVHSRTLKMSDDVLCVRYSPNQALVAVSLIDSTVKVFHQDSLKFFLSLYGHKLPVLTMDISSDSNMIVTGSADKNVKIWGLDFGDCHRSLFAHQDSVMSVQFVPNTHYFFTCGKDKSIKYWDGDKFENILKLDGHHGEVWALAVSPRGDLVVSGSHDRSIRVWERTDEQVFLEEEREKELDDMFESSLTQDDKFEEKDESEAGLAGKKTMETLKAGERIMEALTAAEEDEANLILHDQAMKIYEARKREDLQQLKTEKERNAYLNTSKPPARHRNLTIVATVGEETSPQEYVLRVCEKIRSSDLEEALLTLHFAQVKSLLRFASHWVEKFWNLDLSCKIVFFLLKVHINQISADGSMKPMLDKLRDDIRSFIQRQRDMAGFNLAALRFVKRDWESNESINFS